MPGVQTAQSAKRQTRWCGDGQGSDSRGPHTIECELGDLVGEENSRRSKKMAEARKTLEF